MTAQTAMTVDDQISAELRAVEERLREITGMTDITLEIISKDQRIIQRQSGVVIITMERIMEVVCRVFEVIRKAVQGKRRHREIADARKMYVLLCAHYKIGSLRHIGLMLGGQNHATVIHARKQGCNLLQTDPQFEAKYLTCLKMLEGV